ncbi:MAG: hypothetical protein IJJ99_07220 [Oscillospiraceae bacterium]|nr:hypothetical protein [Oscillospiraceae bacterium]
MLNGVERESQLPCGQLHRPVRTLVDTSIFANGKNAGESGQRHHVGRRLLHSVSAVSVSAAKTPYPQPPSSFSPRDPLRWARVGPLFPLCLTVSFLIYPYKNEVTLWGDLILASNGVERQSQLLGEQLHRPVQTLVDPLIIPTAKMQASPVSGTKTRHFLCLVFCMQNSLVRICPNVL